MKTSSPENKLSQEQLKALLEDAKARVQVGARYQHYKSADMTYKVLDIVIQEVDNQPAVVYQAEYGEKITFVRPLSVWLEKVEFAGTTVSRFTKL